MNQLFDPGFVRVRGRWLKTRNAAQHREAGREVDKRTKPLRAELEVYAVLVPTGRFNEFRHEPFDPCAKADLLLFAH